jgi:hypothetical protein
LFLTTKAKPEILFSESARSDHLDPFRYDALRHELLQGKALQIHMPPVIMTLHEAVSKGGRAKAVGGFAECLEDLRTNLKLGRQNARTQSHFNSSKISAKALKLGNGSQQDALLQTTPTGMDGYDPLLCSEKDGQAVRRSHPHNGPGTGAE